ncbi:MAG TPA: phosphatase [Clostridiaceae bacterium]|jgi:hypothetical protein|nr:phosphatase [Clostridiaceae bacterium]
MSKALEQLALEEKREYYRKWRAENKDKIKKYQETYWKRKAEQKLKEQEEGK